MRRLVVCALALTLLVIPVLEASCKGKPEKPQGKPGPEVATFTITFEQDITGGPFETDASTENWEPLEVKGKGVQKRWKIEIYSLTEEFTFLVDVPIDNDAPEPQFGVPDYEADSSVCMFFDVERSITISWLEHVFSRDYDYWFVALNQTDEQGHNFHLIGNEGIGEYDDSTDSWTVTFSEAYFHIHWWEWSEELGHGVFHNVWKGYMTFTVEIQRMPPT